MLVTWNYGVQCFDYIRNRVLRSHQKTSRVYPRSLNVVSLLKLRPLENYRHLCSLISNVNATVTSRIRPDFQHRAPGAMPAASMRHRAALPFAPRSSQESEFAAPLAGAAPFSCSPYALEPYRFLDGRVIRRPRPIPQPLESAPVCSGPDEGTPQAKTFEEYPDERKVQAVGLRGRGS
jgi:hypothetical protein